MKVEIKTVFSCKCTWEKPEKKLVVAEKINKLTHDIKINNVIGRPMYKKFQLKNVYESQKIPFCDKQTSVKKCLSIPKNKMFPYLDKADDTYEPRYIRRDTFYRTDELEVLGAWVCGGLGPHGAVTGVHGGWESVAEGSHILKWVWRRWKLSKKNIVCRFANVF